MLGSVNKYPVTIKETNLDVYGHVNNATYLVFFEDARWDWIHRNGYGLHKIQETGLGPVILEVTMRYMKELRLRDEIVIQSWMTSYKKKIGVMHQQIMRGDEMCCTADFTFSLFDLKHRKLVLPTEEWLKGIGM